ncbi:phosphotransferase [Fibrobacter sp. UBA4309]|uniref:phosphotransferase n=1 Tax=Fibrobacter sp. UBA4309 TaxID=1946537 RepID=UPI0025B9B9ED|nr:phosphotransferase [Fibrobacter sp. UBA4309]
MESMQDIAQKRWFMGKDLPIAHIEDFDRSKIAGNTLSVIQVSFADGHAPELYATVESENGIGQILEAGFGSESGTVMFRGQKGQFVFESPAPNGQNPFANALRSIAPVDAEQSNSSFVNPGKFFFKLYRRLQAGIHPEAEILSHLKNAGFGDIPEYYGSCRYVADSGEQYTLGILEGHVQGARDAWKVFTQGEPAYSPVQTAKALGEATARMHAALKDMPGTCGHSVEIPFDKLENLLRHPAADDSTRELMEKIASKLTSLRALASKAFDNAATDLFAPQRVHGDYHLGQVLVSPFANAADSAPAFKILDFEGEPSRTLDYRRAKRSPLVDVAGMLRSFSYASACRVAGSANGASDSYGGCESAFLEGYARRSGTTVAELQKACAPYAIAKAVYEACYELEFRPGWFRIPATALLEYAG